MNELLWNSPGKIDTVSVGGVLLRANGSRRPSGDGLVIFRPRKTVRTKPSRSAISFLLVFLAFLFLGLPSTSRASDVSGPEAQELSSLAQLVQAYVNQNGHPPGNWSDIWNADTLLKAKEHHPALAPLYDRYSFVANRYPIFAKSSDDLIQGTILLMHNQVIDLATRGGDLDNRTGREWWFVYLTLDNHVRVGSLSEAQLSSGNGVGRFRLLAPDLPHETVAAFEKKLITLGYTPRPKSRDPVPALELKDTTPASAPIP